MKGILFGAALGAIFMGQLMVIFDGHDAPTKTDPECLLSLRLAPGVSTDSISFDIGQLQKDNSQLLREDPKRILVCIHQDYK
jgi:hypothetical protein